ncbi:4-hydroxy-2-oxoheptanedioate aldolase [Nocardia amikacinitolerans]|uniref:HpcH/HpaI aldolase family protein n=1 Tax=Nocardia amikacinitolerans TaxID=756689 RepID=UPI00082B04A8|nr:aldolase/citrate lyase family protein [Nocardia amikacinitolerans]MCP2315979.1 4-hydroxy-2-oxoheptanedioate aldolase [Nocardia amikacinitolerans]
MKDNAKTSPAGFAERLRAGSPAVGYWVVCDNPVATERIAMTGYDYVCIDAQHGLIEYRGLLAGITAIDAAGVAALVRVQLNDPFWIAQALDAGARGVIVPMVDTAAEAEAAVSACRFPPIGLRSNGALRAGLRIGPSLAEANAEVACVVMIETAAGLRNVAEIVAVPGVDALYVGPSDLRLALGGTSPTDPAVDAEFEDALRVVLKAAAAAGKAVGIHCPDGATAARRRAEGFNYVSIANDLMHIEQAAKSHLAQATDDPVRPS